MAGTMVKTLYDEIYEKGVLSGKSEGKAEGKSEGKAEGKVEGKADVILKQLKKRFGKVSVSVQKQIWAKQDPIVLDSLAVQLLDCKTIEEFIDLL